MTPGSLANTRIRVGGHELRGKLIGPPGKRDRSPAVLFVHGWGGSQRRDIWKGKSLATLGVVCLTFNLRGHAQTRKDATAVSRATNLEDVLAAYDLLAAQDIVDPDGIGLVGSSYGAYLAALASVERKVRWLVLRAPAIYKDDGFDRPKRTLNLDPDLATYRRRRLGPRDNRALAAASRFEGDALVVESEHDSVIPREVVLNYVEAFTSARSVRHHVLHHADHALNAPGWRHEYGEVLRAWFAEHLAGAW